MGSQDLQFDVTRRVEAEPVARADGDPLAGTPYRRISLLGEGGMGEVMLAEHRELGSLAVVKLLHSEMSPDPATLERMRVEAQTGARIQHPNLAAVHHFAQNAAGRPYIVMEYLEGRSLEDELAERGTLPVAEALRVGREVLAGLGAVHRVGVVHRDIKPGNVFLCSDGRVKVLDLGLAKVVELATAATPSPSAHPTDTGVVVGTPRYMAPEQSTSSEVTARTDLYAVGLLLYRMLAGRGPFDDAKTFEEITHAHLMQPPAPPSAMVGRPLPGELDAIILRCLEKDPAARFDSADALARALDAAAVSVALVPPEAVAAQPVERRPAWGQLAILLLSAVLVGLAVGAGVLVLLWRGGP